MIRSRQRQLYGIIRGHGRVVCLVTALILVQFTSAVAPAQGAVLRRPSHQVKQEITRLLDHTLPHFDIDPRRLPGRFRSQVVKYIYEYTMLYRADVQAMFRRATPYLPMIKRTLRELDLPMYFAYIPLVESAFRAEATHPGSGARGLWQLMPLTARGYGLQVSEEIDERLDPKRSTKAAATYIRALRKRFGPKMPLHVLAAYNHGDTNLARVMKKTRTRDIWHLYTDRRLPYQTREYMIKMVSLWVVVAHAERFGFTSEGDTFTMAQKGGVKPWTLSPVAMIHP